MDKTAPLVEIVPSLPSSCLAPSPLDEEWGAGVSSIKPARNANYGRDCNELFCQRRTCVSPPSPLLHPVANGFRSKGCETEAASWVHFSSDPGFFDLSAHLVSSAEGMGDGIKKRL